MKAVGLFEEEVCVDRHSDRVGVLGQRPGGASGVNCIRGRDQLNPEWQLLSEKKHNSSVSTYTQNRAVGQLVI